MSLADFQIRQTGAVDQAKRDKALEKDAARTADMAWEKMVSGLSQADLMALRAKIDTKLTGITLKDVNLVQEMLFQLKAAKELQNTIKADDATPVNQKAQIQNSIAAILTNLAKHQAAVYSAERLKRMEGALIRSLKALPAETQDAFFESYGIELASDPV